jgi:hypothetical protein
MPIPTVLKRTLKFREYKRKGEKWIIKYDKRGDKKDIASCW